MRGANIESKKSIIFSEYSDVIQTVDTIIKQKQQSVKVVVVTPTTGSQYLEMAMKSVESQDYPDVKHLIVIDGEEYAIKTRTITNCIKSKSFDIITLPHNTGKGGLNGHRIYASVPYLINAEYVFFLDQDNWYDSNHISLMIKKMETDGLDWVYSMRKVFTESGTFVSNDDCESIGNYPCYSGYSNLIDTNCYGFKRSILVKYAHYWYHPLQADRYFFHHIQMGSPNFKCTNLYSVNYRLTANRPPHPDFFVRGNKVMSERYMGRLPWDASLQTNLD